MNQQKLGKAIVVDVREETEVQATGLENKPIWKEKLVLMHLASTNNKRHLTVLATLLF